MHIFEKLYAQLNEILLQISLFLMKHLCEIVQVLTFPKAPMFDS